LKFSTSSKVSGSSLPRVSGSISDIIPDIRETTPQTIDGKTPPIVPPFIIIRIIPSLNNYVSVNTAFLFNVME
jgi:hypothetical protein